MLKSRSEAVVSNGEQRLHHLHTFSLLGLTEQDPGITESRTLHLESCIRHHNSIDPPNNILASIGPFCCHCLKSSFVCRQTIWIYYVTRMSAQGHILDARRACYCRWKATMVFHMKKRGMRKFRAFRINRTGKPYGVTTHEQPAVLHTFWQGAPVLQQGGPAAVLGYI